MSFGNVVIDRYPQGQNFITSRSRCPYCQHKLSYVDMVPIFSFLCIKGRCRYCHNEIPIEHFIYEIIGGYLAVICVFFHMDVVKGLYIYCFLVYLIVISMIDLKTLMIPNGFILFCFIFSFLSFYFFHLSLIERMIGFFIISFPLFLINMIKRDSFGGGDIKLMAVCGWLLGWKTTLLSFIIAVMIAGCYVSYLFFKTKKDKETYIAFAPYLSLGMMIALFYGESIMRFYFHMMS